MDGIPKWGWGAKSPTVSSRHCGFSEQVAFVFRGIFKNMYGWTSVFVIILFLCPRTEWMCSRLGKYTLYAYILHFEVEDELRAVTTHVISSLIGQEFLETSWEYSFSILCRLCAPFVLTAVLCSWLVRLVFWIVVEPVWLTRVFRKTTRTTRVTVPETEKRIKRH